LRREIRPWHEAMCAVRADAKGTLQCFPTCQGGGDGKNDRTIHEGWIREEFDPREFQTTRVGFSQNEALLGPCPTRTLQVRFVYGQICIAANYGHLNCIPCPEWLGPQYSSVLFNSVYI
jgi:hypothetical protein